MSPRSYWYAAGHCSASEHGGPGGTPLTSRPATETTSEFGFAIYHRLNKRKTLLHELEARCLFAASSLPRHFLLSCLTVLACRGADPVSRGAMRPGCFFSIPVVSSLFISVIKSKVMKVIITLIVVALLIVLLTSAIWKNRRL